MVETVLAVDGVSFSYAGTGGRDATPTAALADASLEVAAGELVALVGPSGCGKSTLLRIVAGLVDSGHGTLTGRIEVDRDRLGFVFQDPTLLDWRTVHANVELFAELAGVAKPEREAQARALIERVGLAGFEDHHPAELSGGMRMRVSLARSLVAQPTVFLFDEPFAAVDEITRHRLNDEVLDLFAESRFAGLFVTHSVAEAVYLSSRVEVMSPRPGRIIETVPVDFAYPRAPELRFEPEFAATCGRVAEALARATPA